jgi:hypothetical protein
MNPAQAQPAHAPALSLQLARDVQRQRLFSVALGAGAVAVAALLVSGALFASPTAVWVFNPFVGLALGGLPLLVASVVRPPGVVAFAVVALAVAGGGLVAEPRSGVGAALWWAQVGMGALAIAALAALSRGVGRAGTSSLEALLQTRVALNLVGFVLLSPLVLELTVGIHAQTLDHAAYLADTGFGPAPSFAAGRLFAALPVLASVCTAVYLALPLAFCAVAAAELRARSAAARQLPALFFGVGIAGVLAYFFFPVVGPEPTFGAAYPHAPPTLTAELALRSQVTPSFLPRNCMPSLHTAWAVAVFWHARGLGRAWTAAAAVFLALTLLATLGLGAHYVVDLVAGVALVGAVGAALLGAYREALVSVALLLGWMVAVAAAPALFAHHPAVCWPVATAVTLVPMVLLARADARHRASVSLEPEAPTIALTDPPTAWSIAGRWGVAAAVPATVCGLAYHLGLAWLPQPAPKVAALGAALLLGWAIKVPKGASRGLGAVFALAVAGLPVYAPLLQSFLASHMPWPSSQSGALLSWLTELAVAGPAVVLSMLFARGVVPRAPASAAEVATAALTGGLVAAALLLGALPAVGVHTVAAVLAAMALLLLLRSPPPATPSPQTPARPLWALGVGATLGFFAPWVVGRGASLEVSHAIGSLGFALLAALAPIGSALVLLWRPLAASRVPGGPLLLSASLALVAAALGLGLAPVGAWASLALAGHAFAEVDASARLAWCFHYLLPWAPALVAAAALVSAVPRSALFGLGALVGAGAWAASWAPSVPAAADSFPQAVLGRAAELSARAAHRNAGGAAPALLSVLGAAPAEGAGGATSVRWVSPPAGREGLASVVSAPRPLSGALLMGAGAHALTAPDAFATLADSLGPESWVVLVVPLARVEPLELARVVVVAQQQWGEVCVFDGAESHALVFAGPAELPCAALKTPLLAGENLSQWLAARARSAGLSPQELAEWLATAEPLGLSPLGSARRAEAVERTIREAASSAAER